MMRLCSSCGRENPDDARFCNGCGVELGTLLKPQGQPKHVLSQMNRGSSVFVGRRREIGSLRTALEEASAGHGRLIALTGEAGIGKTRTTQELATQAESLGVQVLWGWCYEGQGAPPFWPWIHALRFYLQRKDTEQLKSELGTSAADIAQIIPDVGEILPGLKPPIALEPEQARFRLFDSITTFLRNASQTQPLLLVLDDLHWADRPSLLLLEFVARAFETARVLIIATYRDAEISRGHPLAHTLGELAPQSPFQRVVLRGLNQDEVRRFVEESSSIQHTSSFIEALHSQTEGNPFFLTEVVDYLEREGKLPVEGTGEFRIPQGIRDAINRRLDSLSAECNQTLTLAAVIGQQFGSEQLRLLAEDLSDERLLEVLEEALQARIIT